MKKIGFGTRPSEIKGRDKDIDLEESPVEAASEKIYPSTGPKRKGRKFWKFLLLVLTLVGAGVVLGTLFSSDFTLQTTLDHVKVITGGRELQLTNRESIKIAFSDGLMLKRVVFKGFYRFFPPDDITTEIIGIPQSGNRYNEDLVALLKPEQQTTYELLISQQARELGKVTFSLDMQAADWIVRADAVEDKKIQAACFKKAIALDPDSADAHVALGKYYEGERKLRSAIKEYEAAVRLSPGNLQSLQSLQTLYKRTKNTAKLLTTYEKLARADSAQADTYHFQAGVLAQQKGSTDRAMTFYRKALKKNRAHVEARQRLIKIYEKDKQWNRVAGNTKVLLEYDAKNPDLYLYLSEAYLNMGNISGALSAAENAEKLKGADAATYLQLALLYEKAKKYDKAITYYKKSVARNKKNPAAYNNLGMLLERKGQRKQAITYYEKAVALNPQDPGYYTNLADAYEKEKQLSKAVSTYRKIVGFDKKNKGAWEALAVLYIKLNSKWKSLEAYKELSKLEPKKVLWHQKTAELYEDLNRLEKAREQYKIILQLNPNNKQAKRKYVELSKKLIKRK